MESATRWRHLVRARRAETERLAPGRGAVGPAFWDAKRSRRFAAAMAGTAERDPFLPRVRRATDRRSTVMDVGCGSGRFALVLAPRVARVVAVDWSASMTGIVSRRARRLGLDNVQCVTGRFEDTDLEPVDVSICSFVLPLADRPEVFLAKLTALTRRRAFLYLNAGTIDLLVDPFWRHFHGRPRRPSPTYLDAVAILRDLGASPSVEVVEIPTRTRHTDLAAAVRSYRDTLLLPNTPAVRAELRRLLDGWLVAEPDGRLRPPLRSTPAAIVSWGPG